MPRIRRVVIQLEVDTDRALKDLRHLCLEVFGVVYYPLEVRVNVIRQPQAVTENEAAKKGRTK